MDSSIITRKNAIIASIRDMREERDGLAVQLAAKQTELQEKLLALADAASIRDRLQAIVETPPWAELPSGTAVSAGDRMRYFGRTYECVEAHAKALTRSPLDPRYWRDATEPPSV